MGGVSSSAGCYGGRAEEVHKIVTGAGSLMYSCKFIGKQKQCSSRIETGTIYEHRKLIGIPLWSLSLAKALKSTLFVRISAILGNKTESSSPVWVFLTCYCRPWNIAAGSIGSAASRDDCFIVSVLPIVGSLHSLHTSYTAMGLLGGCLPRENLVSRFSMACA